MKNLIETIKGLGWTWEDAASGLTFAALMVLLIVAMAVL
jgi:hypothetical protein